MTYGQFWNDDVELVKFWREAWRLKQEQKNHELWLQGVYIYEAICDASPLFHDFAKKGTKAVPYRTEPYELFEKRKKEHKKETQEHKTDNKAKAVMEMFMVNFNRRFEKKGGEENGS